MIKFIISAFLIFTILVGTLAIYYWRDSNYDPSQMDLIWSFILLPVSLCLLILSPYFIYKTIQNFRNKKLQQQKDQELSILVLLGIVLEKMKKSYSLCSSLEALNWISN